MDPSLRREKEAFKRRAIAATEKSRKYREAAAAKSKPPVAPVSKPHKAKKKAHSSPTITSTDSKQTLKEIKDAARQAYGTNNRTRILKCVMDLLKMRYIDKEKDDELTFDGILNAIDLSDIRYEVRQWIRGALTSNTKVKFISEKDSFVFLPALGHQVRCKKQLLMRLQQYDMQGLGGITMTDITEAIPKANKIVERLVEEERVMRVIRQDKEQIIFYNNLEYSLEQKVCPELQELWHQVSVDGMTETDIDKYLSEQGLGAMQGETRKRKAPSSSTHKKSRKKMKPSKVLNTHLDNKLLRDYSTDNPGQNQK